MEKSRKSRILEKRLKSKEKDFGEAFLAILEDHGKPREAIRLIRHEVREFKRIYQNMTLICHLTLKKAPTCKIMK